LGVSSQEGLLTTAGRILKNFFSLASAGIISQGLGFVVIVYLARILGVANFGKVVFAQAIFVYFMLITNLGLPTLGAREIARDKNKIEHYVNNILTIRLVLAGISFCLLLLFIIFISISTEIKQLIIIFGLSVFPFALLFEWVFQGTEKMEYIGISRVLNKLFYVLLIFILIKSSKQLLLIPFAWLVGEIVVSGFLIYLFIKQFNRIELSFNIPFWRDSLKKALPMGIAFMLNTIYINFGTIMLGFMKGNEVVGCYNAAYKIVLFILGIGGLYATVIFPIVSEHYKGSLKKLQFLLSRSTKLMITIGLPFGVAGTILARPIMNLIYGSQYDNGIIAFQILIWSVVIIFISILYGYSLMACDRQKNYLAGVAIGAVIHIGLNIILIPSFSLIGASIATIITELTVFIYMYFDFKQIVEVPFKQYFLKPFIASTVMGVFLCYFLNLNIFGLVTLGLLVYFTGISLLKGISREELVMLRRATIEK